MKRVARFLLALVVIGGVLLVLGIGGIRDNLQTVIPYDTLTADQVKKGAVISGEVKYNLGSFAEEYQTRNGVRSGGSTYYYAIMVGDKVMALGCGKNSRKADLDYQANLITKNLSSWDDVGKDAESSEDSKDTDAKDSKKKGKKSKKNDETEDAASDSVALAAERPVAFKGVVKKLDSDVEKYLKEYLTPKGANEPVLEIVPYSVSVSMMTMGASVGLTIGGVVVLLIAGLLFVKFR